MFDKVIIILAILHITWGDYDVKTLKKPPIYSNGKLPNLINPINSPVITRHRIETKPFISHGQVQSPIVVVEANPIPLRILLRSESSDLVIKNVHVSKPGKHKMTRVIDEPHVVHHEIRRPIIHRVNELIIPVRDVVQQFKPIQENIRSIFPESKEKKANDRPAQDVYGETATEEPEEPSVTTVDTFNE